MKTFKGIMLIFLLILFPALSYPQSLGDLRISLIDGDVQIRTEDTGDWVPASINMPLREGDRIWVPEGSRTELQLRDGTYLRLGEKSALEILTIDKDSFQFYLDTGHLYSYFRGQKGTVLQLDTSLASVRAYDPSSFRLDISDDGANQVSVFRGTVEAESRSGRTTVTSGRTLVLKGEIYAELSPLGPPDEWERWNRARDNRVAEWRPPARYLPDELSAYSRDFEDNGRWTYAREYGYVWTPTVIVSSGWAPYRIGRWVWMGGNYVWISYEPWGWCHYHYGRWAFIPAIGWCWVPPVRGAVFWGPGFVGWVWTPTYVAWVPLAPGEIYYGRGYYGPHSVNITHVNVTNIQVNKVVYRNVHIHNAVTVVHHDTFVKGKRVDVKVKENPFLKEKISIGGPHIKPEKATTAPVIKEIPERKRPPRPIREANVKELKEKRPLVRERNVSVLRPQSPPKDMPLKVKEGKPIEREFEKTKGSAPGERSIEKPRESRTPEKRTEKPKSPEGGVEIPKESKPPEKGIERPKDSRPMERGTEKPRETKLPEGGVEKSKELRPPEKRMESPKESTHIERGMEKQKELQPSREIKIPSKGVEGPKESEPIEKGIERFREPKAPERRAEKTRVIN
jgi:hypothetical protein